jgi:UDP:flavonoid glycosyltransferase YjiC (YdhE family)
MRILITSTGGAGHLQPLLPYAEAFRRGGHDLRVAAPASVADILQKADLDHAVLPDPTPDAAKPVMAQMDAAKGADAYPVAIQELFYGIRAEAALPAVLSIARDWRPDLVLREASEPCGALAAESFGLPHARVNVHNPVIEDLFVRLGAEPVDALRRAAGLVADQGAALRAEAVFTGFPAALDATLPRTPPFRVRGDAPRPAAHEKDDLPLVYMTLGTLAGRSPKSQAAFRTLMTAVADLPLRALMTLGPVMPTAELGPIPANVRVETFVPQADVLCRATAVLCHGGAGTVLGTLAAGLPMVITPLFADQPANATSVAASGAGIAVVDGTAADIRAALEKVLADPTYRQRAREIAAEISALPDMDAAVGTLQDLVKG